MSKKQANRVKATSMMHAFEQFCEKHLKAVPGWLAAEYLNMTPQGLYQASERGWIAYFQHGRNRIYSYRDVINYRWRSRKFKDNRPTTPYEPGKAKFEVEIVPPRPPTPAEIEAQERAAAIQQHDQAFEAIKGKAPWPFERE